MTTMSDTCVHCFLPNLPLNVNGLGADCSALCQKFFDLLAVAPEPTPETGRPYNYPCTKCGEAMVVISTTNAGGRTYECLPCSRKYYAI